ncbi:pre-mRNA-splicing factor cwc22 [Tulasnella sp. JGI-2019a]|nr:pre-mRNA-splicing factor cwc22 [Tulasnella sp. JGI-2019a]
MSAIVQTAPLADSSLYKRKRSHSRSKSPVSRARSPPHRRRRSVSPNAVRVEDADPVRRQERERQLAVRLAEEEAAGTKKPEFDAQAEFAKLMTSKSGGVYMPPARLRALQAAASKDKSSADYQRLSWDALRKSLTGIVNRVNIGNIKDVVPELFAENLIRGRGLFARSVMKAQASSLPFTPVFACMVAIINTKLPQVGELVLTRLISQFRRSFKRNDKVVCHATSTFIAHLVNQGVAHEIIALQMLVLLLERPTDDSVEIAVGFMREVGAFLAENSPKANNGVYERFRAVLHEGAIDKRVQYMIEVLFQVRKDKYKDNPILPEGLDLVQEDDQITHQISLDDELQVQEGLNIYKFDASYLENEAKYKTIKDEILGGSDESDSDSGSEEDSDDEEEPVEEKAGIEDMTETNLTNLRRVIYLTIMNSLNYEEAVHKLMKINIQEGQEIELCNMVIECCSQERSYSNFYGLIGERFSKLNRVWCENFEEAFATYYDTIHRYETNRLRNIARFFGHLLASDAISWAVFSVVKMNEDDTTSSSRIFVKILMQEMMEEMGLKKLAERFKDPTMAENYQQLFPLDNPKNTRFSINYFTSIGLGIVTEEMREHLKNAPRIIMEQRRAALEEESSSSDSDSDDSSTDSSDSDSDSDSSGSRSPPPRRRRSSTPPRRRSRSPRRSISPIRRNRSRSADVGRRRASLSHSRSPPPRRSAASGSRRDESPPRKDRYRSPPPKDRSRDGGRRSPSPPPRHRNARDRTSVSRSPPPRRRRYSDESPPPPRRDRRDRSPTPDRYRRDRQ